MAHTHLDLLQQPHNDVLERMLRHVPDIDIRFDGDCSHASGLDLPIVAINLDRRRDRWDTLSKRMSAVGLTKLIRAPAVDGAHLSEDRIASLLGVPADRIAQAPRSHLSLTRPAVGCFLSHLAVWRWVIDTDLPRVLVLEDDAAPAPNYDADRLRSFMATLPNEMGLVFLGRIIMGGLAEQPFGSPLARLYYFNGTFAYLITPAACRVLLRHLLPPRSHIDHQISRVLIEQRRVFPAYYSEPHFFEPDWSLRSDCYVPLAEDGAADRELEEIILASRRTLLGENRPLLPTSPAG